MGRFDDLVGIETSINRIGRIGNSREAARRRAERAGVTLSRPSVTILAALRSVGRLRMSNLAETTRLEAPLVSREVRDLVEGGYVIRRPDPGDGRVGIVELTPLGRQTSERHRAAVDEIMAETFAAWSEADLTVLAGLLERVAADFARPA